MILDKYDITIKYSEKDGVITVIKDGVEKKTKAKLDQWGKPDLRYIDLAYLAVTLTGGTGEGDYWILDADEDQINKEYQGRDHSFVLHHIGQVQLPFIDGYMQTHYEGSRDSDSFCFLNGNPRGKETEAGGAISLARATISYDAYNLGIRGQEKGLNPKLPLYLEFVNHDNRQNNETILRFEFVDQEIPEWEPQWFREDGGSTDSDRNEDGSARLKFV